MTGDLKEVDMERDVIVFVILRRRKNTNRKVTINAYQF